LLIEYETQCGDSGIFKVRFQHTKISKVIAPKEWTPRSSDYEDVKFTVKSKQKTCPHPLFLEPIEQNVNGSRGIYELVYFVKDSKSLERFKA